MAQPHGYYPRQLTAKLGDDYHQALWGMAKDADLYLADLLRAVIEEMAADAALRARMCQRALDLQGLPGQQQTNAATSPRPF